MTIRMIPARAGMVFGRIRRGVLRLWRRMQGRRPGVLPMPLAAAGSRRLPPGSVNGATR
jgi:hypothetical protein